jgi:hypothetical protein
MNPTITSCARMGKAVHSPYYIALSTFFGFCKAIFRVTTVDSKVMNATLCVSTYTLCRFMALTFWRQNFLLNFSTFCI